MQTLTWLPEPEPGTRANVAIAHLLCNIKKKDRVSFEEVTYPSAAA